MACCTHYVAVLHDEQGDVIQEFMITRPIPTLVLPVMAPSVDWTQMVTREPLPQRYDTFDRKHSQTRQQGVIEAHYYRRSRP